MKESTHVVAIPGVPRQHNTAAQSKTSLQVLVDIIVNVKPTQTGVKEGSSISGCFSLARFCRQY